MRTCRKCNTQFEGTRCKPCQKAYNSEHYVKNLKQIREAQKEYYLDNKEKWEVYSKTRDEEKQREAKRRWQKKNQHKHNANTAAYRAAKDDRTPVWLSEDHKWMIAEVYELSALRSETTGVPHAVDHIVPLRGELVSGLHVPWNLQVIPARENESKGNAWQI